MGQYPRRVGATDYRALVTAKDRAELWLYGPIGLDYFGDGITAKQFADNLRSVGAVANIDLRIDSEGGVVTDARAMYSLLNEHPAQIVVHIDGLAASAASFIAMAGDEIEISEGGLIMIHNAHGITFGGAEDFRRMADVLDVMNSTIRNTYRARTGNSDEQLTQWMDAETWFSGKDAVANKFADRIVSDKRVAAAVADPTRYRNLPPALRPNRAAAIARIKNTNPRQIRGALTAA